MATLKQRLHRKNSSGGYDTIHMETSSDLVKRPDGSTVEQSLTTLGNTKVDLDENGKVPTEQLPDMGYTKEETLSNETKGMYGLDPSAIPNDSFKVIANSIFATLQVIAPQESTIIVQRNNRTLVEKSTGSLGDGVSFWNYGGLEMGTWTITCTYDNNTRETTLEVTEVKGYKVETDYYSKIKYNVSLYDGDLGNSDKNQCKEVTGGWIGSTERVTNGSWNSHVGFRTSNLFDFFKGDILYVRRYNNTRYCLTKSNLNYQSWPTYIINPDANVNEVFYEFTENYLGYRLGACFIATGSYTGSYSYTDYDLYFRFTGNNSSFYGHHSRSFIFREDEWRTLANIINVNVSNISELLNHSESILTNQNAVRFMISRCTGKFMINAVRNSTFKTALSNSDYSNLLYADSDWAKFITMFA